MFRQAFQNHTLIRLLRSQGRNLLIKPTINTKGDEKAFSCSTTLKTFPCLDALHGPLQCSPRYMSVPPPGASCLFSGYHLLGSLTVSQQFPIFNGHTIKFTFSIAKAFKKSMMCTLTRFSSRPIKFPSTIFKQQLISNNKIQFSVK